MARPSMWRTVRLWTWYYQYVALFYIFIWIKAWSRFSLFIIINTKETFTSTVFLLIYQSSKKWQCNVTFDSEDMLHFLKHLTSWSCFVLHLLMSLRWLTDYKSLARYHVYPRLKIVTETFPEKVQHKSATATCNCTTDMCATPFCVALFTL